MLMLCYIFHTLVLSCMPHMEAWKRETCNPIVDGFMAYDKNRLLYYLFLLKCKNNTYTHMQREKERESMYGSFG